MATLGVSAVYQYTLGSKTMCESSRIKILDVH